MKKIAILILLSFCITSTAFSLSFDTLQGRNIYYDNMIASPKVILFLWATWCPHCITKLRYLSEDCERFGNIELYAISVGEQKAKVKKFIQRENIPRCMINKIVIDKTSFFARKFSIRAIPTFIFLENGKVVHKTNSISKNLVESIFE